ncbi:hypothetical protein CI41S_20310 [Bradyrhizobium ivorense]|nr:hypothetical protein CI41S_20310 [Bradyrhizobium ivorense]
MPYEGPLGGTGSPKRSLHEGLGYITFRGRSLDIGRAHNLPLPMATSGPSPRDGQPRKGSRGSPRDISRCRTGPKGPVLFSPWLFPVAVVVAAGRSALQGQFECCSPPISTEMTVSSRWPRSKYSSSISKIPQATVKAFLRDLEIRSSSYTRLRGRPLHVVKSRRPPHAEFAGVRRPVRSGRRGLSTESVWRTESG